MKKIFLTQGQFTIVDDEDYEELNQYSWCAHYQPGVDSYYAERHETLSNKKRITIHMHRLILGLEKGDKRQGDHIHHDTLDNRRSEIRVVSNRQNSSNRKNRCSSKYTGVSWEPSRNKWKAVIKIGKRSNTIGMYNVEEEASDAYQNALSSV